VPLSIGELASVRGGILGKGTTNIPGRIGGLRNYFREWSRTHWIKVRIGERGLVAGGPFFSEEGGEAPLDERKEDKLFHLTAIRDLKNKEDFYH